MSQDETAMLAAITYAIATEMHISSEFSANVQGTALNLLSVTHPKLVEKHREAFGKMVKSEIEYAAGLASTRAQKVKKRLVRETPPT